LNSDVKMLKQADGNLLRNLVDLWVKLKGFYSHYVTNWADNYHNILLLILLLVGFFTRFSGIMFGLPYLHHWDEPPVVRTAIKIMQSGDWNPHYFHYPSLLIYLQIPFYILNYFRLMGSGQLSSLADIVTSVQTGWSWTISHPSFYFVGRLITVVLGVLSILLVYQIGKRYFNKEIGLLSAAILTFFQSHIQHSRYITPNVPVSFFTLLSLLLISLYIEKGLKRYLLFAGFSAGLTVATKYNSFLILVPVLFAILFYSQKRIQAIVLALAATAAGFFVGCPYSVFAVNTFLHHAGSEVRRYKVLGIKGGEGVPGIPQFKYYLNVLRGWADSTFLLKNSWIMAIFGFVACFLWRTKSLIIISSFPLSYIFYMSLQKVNFSRNVICMIPFIALFTGIGIYQIYRFILFLLNKSSFVKKREVLFQNSCFIVVFVILTLSFSPISKIQNGYNYLRTYKESRTRAVDYIQKNYANSKIAISKELRVHQRDLDKIKNYVLMDSSTLSETDLHKEGFGYLLSSDNFSYGDTADSIEDLPPIGSVLNGGFEAVSEDKPNSWKVDPGGGWKVSQDQPYEGATSMQTTQSWSWLWQEVSVQPKTWYTVEARVRSDIIVEGKGDYENTFLTLECLDKDDRVIRTEWGIVTAFPKWEKRENKIYAPETTRRIRIKLAKRLGEGSVWFDDVKFTEVPYLKLPKENIMKSFGWGKVRLDIYSVEPKVNIYKIDESFTKGSSRDD